MLFETIAAYFRHKVVNSIVILACWSLSDQTKYIHNFTNNGVRATFSCDLTALNLTNRHGLHGVMAFSDDPNKLLLKVKWIQFATWYKWLIVGDSVPETFLKARYDLDASLLNIDKETGETHLLDVYIHPRDGITLHPWAMWNNQYGLTVLHDYERILRRNNLKKYSLKIAVPNGLYSPEKYNGTFAEYVVDERNPEVDSANRCGYAGAVLIADSLNATNSLIHSMLWNSQVDNRSMYVQVSTGVADISGTILRILPSRLSTLNFITAIWPFRVGFTYIAERESSSNMYIEPFTQSVWLTFFAMAAFLALGLRVTAKGFDERRDALYSAIASSLQQDSNTVPQGGSGRTVFMTLCICSMLVHAYYTSAIVSALMKSGRGGPETLRALGDSRLSIAAEDYDWTRYSFFEVQSNWSDLEYLKEKKKTPQFYQTIEKGIKMVATGNTAYHTEYNSLYPYLKELTDDQVCKLQYVDTIPQVMTYILATKWSQYSNILNSKGAWLHETGIADRTTKRWVMKPPPCRAALLAERVKFGDVMPLLTVTLLGAILSVIVLTVEIFIFNVKGKIKDDSNVDNLITEKHVEDN